MAAQTLTIGKALNLGLRKALEDDPKVLLMGEDIGKLGGVFRVTEHLQRDFGEKRVLDTPLAESGIVGTAIGLAMAAELRAACLALPEPSLTETFDWVYAEQTPYLRAQQAAHAEYVATFEDEPATAPTAPGGAR